MANKEEKHTCENCRYYYENICYLPLWDYGHEDKWRKVDAIGWCRLWELNDKPTQQ